MPICADVKFAKVRILLVDSAPANVEFVRLALSQAAELPFEVCWAGDLAGAFAHLRLGTFDVALLNLSLPDCAGVESLQMLRQRCRAVPVLVLAAAPDDATALKAIELGAQDFHVIGKVSAKALIRSIRFAIQRQQATAAATQYRIELEAYGTLAGIVESAGDAIESAALSGEIVTWNDAATRLFGYAPSEAIGKSVSMLFSPDDADEMQRILRDMTDAPRVRRWETERTTKDGRTVPVSMLLSPMPDREGRVFAVSIISREIAPVRMRRESVAKQVGEPDPFQVGLEHTHRKLQQFAFVAAQDVKEQLRMTVNAFLLLDLHCRDRLDTVGQQYLQCADDGVKRMQRIVDDLLSLTPVGLPDEPSESIDLRETVDEVIANLDFAVQSSGARIEVDALPRVLGNRNALKSLFQELIVNAITFRRESSPVVRVSSTAVDGGWEFAVADDGLGIQPGCYDRVLELFQRLYAAFDYTGAGTGLSRCRQIVELHGGRIWVETCRQAGCTIRFTLPHAAPAVCARHVPRSIVEEVTIPGARSGTFLRFDRAEPNGLSGFSTESCQS